MATTNHPYTIHAATEDSGLVVVGANDMDSALILKDLAVKLGAVATISRKADDTGTTHVLVG